MMCHCWSIAREFIDSMLNRSRAFYAVWLSKDAFP